MNKILDFKIKIQTKTKMKETTKFEVLLRFKNYVRVLP